MGRERHVLDPRGHRLHPVGPPGGQDDVVAGLGQPDRGRCPDPAATPGDDGNRRCGGGGWCELGGWYGLGWRHRLGWRHGLDEKPRRARWFYAVIVASTLVGAAINFVGVNPVTALFWTAVLSIIIGVILASAFPAIVVYAQTIIPGRVGMVAGLFFGLAFGFAGIGAAVLGWLADQTSIAFVYHVCAFLPAIGLLAALLPETAKAKLSRAVKGAKEP